MSLGVAVPPSSRTMPPDPFISPWHNTTTPHPVGALAVTNYYVAPDVTGGMLRAYPHTSAFYFTA